MNNQTPQPDNRFQKVTSVILNNDRFLVAVDGKNFDSVAAASGLALMLKSLGKQIVLYSPQPIKKEDFAPLSGLDDFVQKIEGSGNKLLMTFDCPLDSIEKVSSNDESEKLNLVVEFKDGVAPVDPGQVKIKQANPTFSAGFAINCPLPDEEELIKKGQWVWMAQGGGPRAWAQVSLVEKKATFSESMASMLSRTNLKMPIETAKNLYFGLKKGTNNFSMADSIALETAAYCLRVKEDLEKISVAQPPASGMIQPPTEQPVNKVPMDQPPIDKVESKEGGSSGSWQKPPIFTGATTPKV